ncbi:dihydrodipicolinate synthase family protein [uncultured Paludibaculum sp.]|uniref:dihydrodipicolinate synthase family protein n=1 Tax=uncultured Paludibaculum sp. TaxID=1765020 RepID=UPI002AABB911|nr:dihydrodipicolinate synthase family protein [uncultured Paludibaculum sp.]
MTPIKTLGGILPAVITPLDENEQFAPKPFERLVEMLYAQGCHGLYVCGQTGEGPLLPPAQRRLVAEAAVRNSPRGKSVVIHVGAHTTRETIELARHAQSIGATAVSSLPPTGPWSFSEIKSFYSSVASAVDIPTIVYFFPELYPVISNLDCILELLQIPNVIGLKFTHYNLYQLEICRGLGKIAFNGRDEMLTSGLLVGAEGGIGTFYNLVPELVVAIYNHARNHQWDEANSLQTKLNALIRLTLNYPMLPAVKQILAWRGFPVGPCVAPRLGLTALQEATLRDELAALGYAHWTQSAALR